MSTTIYYVGVSYFSHLHDDKVQDRATVLNETCDRMVAFLTEQEAKSEYECIDPSYEWDLWVPDGRPVATDYYIKVGVSYGSYEYNGDMDLSELSELDEQELWNETSDNFRATQYCFEEKYSDDILVSFLSEKLCKEDDFAYYLENHNETIREKSFDNLLRDFIEDQVITSDYCLEDQVDAN